MKRLLIISLLSIASTIGAFAATLRPDSIYWETKYYAGMYLGLAAANDRDGIVHMFNKDEVFTNNEPQPVLVFDESRFLDTQLVRFQFVGALREYYTLDECIQ
jgi:hypothetical protein